MNEKLSSFIKVEKGIFGEDTGGTDETAGSYPAPDRTAELAGAGYGDHRCDTVYYGMGFVPAQKENQR